MRGVYVMQPHEIVEGDFADEAMRGERAAEGLEAFQGLQEAVDISVIGSGGREDDFRRVELWIIACGEDLGEDLLVVREQCRNRLWAGGRPAGDDDVQVPADLRERPGAGLGIAFAKDKD